MALIGVVMVVLIMVSLGAAVLSTVTGSAVMVENAEASLKALYAADGGIRKFIVQISNNPHVDRWPDDIWDGFADYPVGDAIIESIHTKDRGSCIEVTVVGRSGSARKTLVAQITKPVPNDLSGVLQGLTATASNFTLPGSTFLLGDLYVGGSCYLEESSRVQGNIIVRGDISSADGAVIDGNIFAGGEISIDEKSTLKGVQQDLEGGAIPSFPELDMDRFRREAETVDQYFDSSLVITSKHLDHLSGVYFIDGDASFSTAVDGYSGRGLIIASDGVAISGGLDLTPEDKASSLGIITPGNIVIDGGTDFFGVLAAGGNLAVYGSGVIKGSAAARTVSAFEKNFAYEEDYLDLLSDELLWSGCKTEVLRWSERYPVY